MIQPFEEEIRDWDEHLDKLASGVPLARVRLRFARWTLLSRSRLRAREGAPDEARQLFARAERASGLLAR